jgi:hypothetical protein
MTQETKNIIVMIIIGVLLVAFFSLTIYLSILIATSSFNTDTTNKIFDNYLNNILQYNMR